MKLLSRKKCFQNSWKKKKILSLTAVQKQAAESRDLGLKPGSTIYYFCGFQNIT